MEVAPKDHAYFEMSFYPNVELVSTVRRFVLSAYKRLLQDSEVADQVALATHELLENAVKYSADDVTHLRVGVARTQDHDEVTITTRNCASAEDIRALEAVLLEMHDAPDAFLFYQKKMRETVRRLDSGLGLARVHAEADMNISCEAEGHFVTIFARGNFSRRQTHG
jgi:anti-sigma regulatory factor (Ser/Thr protein kinase)